MMTLKEITLFEKLLIIVSSTTFDNVRTVIKPHEIVNVFKKHFFNVTSDIQYFINYTRINVHKIFRPIDSYYLSATQLIKT